MGNATGHLTEGSQALLPNLRAGSQKRVVNVTSKMGSIDDAGFVRPSVDVFVSKKLPFTRLSDETEHFEKGRPR